jgi:hypothetical protein
VFGLVERLGEAVFRYLRGGDVRELDLAILDGVLDVVIVDLRGATSLPT